MRYNGRTDSSTIAGRLRELGFERYADYLASDHWKEIRRRYYASGRSRECSCGARATALHHLTYERLGAERLEDLEAVCRPCHRERHRIAKVTPKPAKARKPKRKPPHRKKRRSVAVKPNTSGKGYRRGEVKDGAARLTFHP